MVNRWVSYVLRPFEDGYLVRRFRLALYAILLWQALYLWLDYADVLGEYSVAAWQYPRGGFFTWYAHLFAFPSMEWAHPFLLALHILALLVGLMGKLPRMISVVVFFTTNNLFTLLATEQLTGGENLISVMLFMLMFVFERPRTAFANAWMNTLLLAMRLQLCLLYLMAGLNKLPDPAWLDGEAFSISLNMLHYSTDWVPEFFKEKNWLTALATWMALGYQLLFCILVWFRPIRKPLFALGLGFHLGIIFLMGLPTFSLAMMACYLLFPVGKRDTGSILRSFRKGERTSESPVEEGTALHQ